MANLASLPADFTFLLPSCFHFFKNSRNTPLALTTRKTIMVTIKISINYQIKLKKKSLPTCFPVSKIAFSLGVFHPLFRSVNMPGVSQKTNSHFRHRYQRCPNITPQGSAKSVSPFSRCVSWTDFSKGPFAPSVSIHVLRVLTSHPLHHVIECPPLHWNCSYYHHE